MGQVGVLEQDLGDVVETEVGLSRARAQLATGSSPPRRPRLVATMPSGAWPRRHVISLIRPANLKSQGVARKMGMVPERTIEWRGFTHIVFGIRRPGL